MTILQGYLYSCNMSVADGCVLELVAWFTHGLLLLLLLLLELLLLLLFYCYYHYY